MKFTLEAVARAIGAVPAPGDVTVSGWSVDSRTLVPGDVFFALRGPNHDGHDHVADALAGGAAAVVVGHATGSPAELLVPDTLAALQCLGGYARRRWGGTVVAVTGSAGKTTTKDAIAHLLSLALPVGKTTGNFNNHVGVPLSILRLPEESRAAVLEMGMNHAGEIRELASVARPEIGVVTNVGYAHAEAFGGSIEGVALAKRELIEALPPAGIAVLNGDDPRVRAFASIHRGRTVTFGASGDADFRATDVELRPEGAVFRVEGVPFETTLAGRHGVLNLLAAIAVARVFGVPLGRLPDAVRSFAAGAMRGERIERDGMVIWNDCYNANPEAMRAMLDVLRATPAARRIAVLGEMLELGSAAGPLHRAVGRHAAEAGIDILIGVRGNAREMVEEAAGAGLASTRFFDSPAEAGAFAREVARSGDALLFKGSRGVAVERALESFLA